MQGALRWIVRILCLGLACLLAFLLLRYQKEERAHNAHIEQLHREAEAYETQLKTIQNELDAMKASVGSENKSGLITIAFQVQSTNDLDRITNWATQYGFTPVIVLDTETGRVERIMDAAAGAGYEIVLTAMPFEAEIPARAAAMRERLQGEHASADSDLFLLREAYENEDNLSALSGSGFGGCICYYGHAAFSEAHPEFLLMSYSYLKDADFSVQKRLKEMSDGREALMFVFDLTSVELTPEAAERFLTVICDYAAEHGLAITTVAETCDAIRMNRVNTASGQEAYEALLQERQAEIDALKEKLDDIYSRWKGEQPE